MKEKKTTKPAKKAEKVKKSEVPAKKDKKVKKPAKVEKEAKPEKHITVDEKKVAELAEKEKARAKKREAKEKAKADLQLGDPNEIKNLIGTLTRESILVKLELSAWRGTGSDKELAAQYAGQMGGGPEGFTIGLKFLPPDIRKELNNRLAKPAKLIKENTIPMGDGFSLLASTLYAPLKQAVENARIEIKEYINWMTKPEPYDKIVKYAKATLGQAYKDERIPSPDVIRSKFSVNLKQRTVEIPTKLEGVDPEGMEELRTEMMEDYARRYQNAILDIIEGLKETMETLVEELEGSQDRDKYQTILKMCESRIQDILRLDIFKSKRIFRALEHINNEVLNPLRESIFILKKDSKKRGELAKTAKKAIKDVLDNVRV